VFQDACPILEQRDGLRALIANHIHQELVAVGSDIICVAAKAEERLGCPQIRCGCNLTTPITSLLV